MRRPLFTAYASAALPGELVVDNFAGGGGASTGIEEALGRPVDIAINHNPEAIAMHKANHPETKHYCENIWEVDPVEACAGRPVGLAWFSPDCTHFSKAKGGQPRKKEIRGLAGVVIRWAKAVRPRIILLENVEEFQTWGPLDDEGHPIPGQMGDTFREWLAELTACGYRVEFRTLVAADFGAPTTRKRLFLIARCDGGPLVFPMQTHGAGREPWRTAAEVIDWSLPCPSIFDRKRPLAEATMKRVVAGIRRYVIGAAQPFVVPVKSWGGGGNGPRSVEDLMRTITASKRGEFAVVDPFIMPLTHHQGGARGHSVIEPFRTVTAAHRGEMAIVEPFIVRHGHVSSITGLGDTMRGQRLDKPLATVCTTNDKHIVCPIITKHYGGVVGHDVERPLGTITTQDHHSLTAAYLTKFFGTSTGSPMDRPMPTVTACGQHIGEVRALLIKYYGEGGQLQDLRDPLHTLTTKARFGLVTVLGEDYVITDIGMRMLQPHELFAAQGFPDDYEIRPEFNGKPLTKTAQTSLAGNSVCPPVAAALVAANINAQPVSAAA